MTRKRTTPARRSTAESVREYGRGVAGGLLFSLPLLYTMEVWEAGFTLPPHRQLAFLVGTCVLLLGYNRYSGLHPDTTWLEVAIDSVEELGRIVVEALVIAIGVSVGTAQLGGDDEPVAEERQISVGGHVILAACGAILFAANVAPTDEILIMGIELPPEQLIGLGVLSVALSGPIVYYSDFRGSPRRSRKAPPSEMIRSIVITYAVGLVSSALTLWLFGRFDGTGLPAIVGQTVVLGVAASLGASAGKLLLQR